MGEVAYDPSAPGAAAASQTQGPVCGAPYIHGSVAGTFLALCVRVYVCTCVRVPVCQ